MYVNLGIGIYEYQGIIPPEEPEDDGLTTGSRDARLIAREGRSLGYTNNFKKKNRRKNCLCVTNRDSK